MLPYGQFTSSGKGGGVTNTTVCLRPGRLLPTKTTNSENPELYAVHPFRQAGVNIRRDLGVASYNARKNHGDTGWSEDLMDAALLGMPAEATRGAIARAEVPPFSGYRWPGFQPGIGAGGPITDHGGVGASPPSPPHPNLIPNTRARHLHQHPPILKMGCRSHPYLLVLSKRLRPAIALKRYNLIKKNQKKKASWTAS